MRKEHHTKDAKKSARQWRAQFSPRTHFDPSDWMIFYKEIRLAEIYIFEKRYNSCRGSRDNLVADDRYNVSNKRNLRKPVGLLQPLTI